MAAPPNLVWIVTTQWRAMATGYAGDPNASTPCLDALASGSVNYTQAVTPHPFGPFARAALFTGVPSPENGVREYYDPLPPTSRTIAHELSARGYGTAFIGKWHLAPRDPQAPLVGETHARQWVAPEYRGGFAHWDGFESGFLLNDPWLHGSVRPVPVQRRGYQSDVLVDEARTWLAGPAAQLARPWFLVVSLEPPHPPYDAPVPAVTSRGRDESALQLRPNVPRAGEAESRARRELRGYYAHVAATDRAIGRLVADMPAGTRVIFTSVHGDMHGSQGVFRKGWPYEESVRVPLLVHEVGQRQGSTCEDPVSLLDLVPMSLAWVDGREWRLDRDRAEISMPSVVPFAWQCDRAWRGWRSPTRKVVQDRRGVWLDFDLATDPYEQRNRASESGGRALT